MGAVSLWPLVLLRQLVGLVARTDLWRGILPSVLGAGVCVVLGLGRRVWLRVGFGGWGGFGWLPIGPCDYFHPWWGGYRGRFGVVGFHGGFNRYGGFAPLHGGTPILEYCEHSRRSHRSRAVDGQCGALRRGPGDGRAATREQIGGARMMAGNLPVVPSQASLSASGRAAAPSTMRNGSEHFFGSVHNNVARPASFQQQTASLRQTMQQNHVGASSGGRSHGRRGWRIPTARSTSSNLQRPSAGTLSNREMNNPGNRGGANLSSAENGNHAGYRPFTPPSSNTHPSAPVSPERTSTGPGNVVPNGARCSPLPAGTRWFPAVYAALGQRIAAKRIELNRASRQQWNLLESDGAEFDGVARQQFVPRQLRAGIVFASARIFLASAIGYAAADRAIAV